MLCECEWYDRGVHVLVRKMIVESEIVEEAVVGDIVLVEELFEHFGG